MDEYVRLINKTEDFIETNLDKKITLDEVARNINMSKFHFHRIFKMHSHETIKQFIRRIKMERSALFLAVRKDISITEIAFRYGYGDSSAYNKVFKTYYGVSPSEYRKARNDKSKSY